MASFPSFKDRGNAYRYKSGNIDRMYASQIKILNISILILITAIIGLIMFIYYNMNLDNKLYNNYMNTCSTMDELDDLRNEFIELSNIANNIEMKINDAKRNVHKQNGFIDDISASIDDINDEQININHKNIEESRKILSNISDTINGYNKKLNIGQDKVNWIGGIYSMSNKYTGNGVASYLFSSNEDETQQKTDRVFGLTFPNIIGNEIPDYLNPSDCLAFPFDETNDNPNNNDYDLNDESLCDSLDVKESNMNYIEFMLRDSIVIQSFEYRHIKANKIPQKNYNYFIHAKPKCFQLFGTNNPDNKNEYQKLGSGVMNINHDTFSKQFNDKYNEYRFLKIYFNNHGSNYSCLYRMKVMGQSKEKMNQQIIKDIL